MRTLVPLLFIPCLAAAPAAPPQAAVDADRVMADLASLPTARAATGDIAHQQGLADTETLLITRLREMGLKPILEPIPWNLQKQIDLEARIAAEESRPDSPDSPPAPPRIDTRVPAETTPELASRTWHNIVVEFPGADLPHETLIIGAHFDAVPGTPGADDNGTGVAALLETARILKDRPMRRTVRLVFFNLEEIGLHGAREHARAFKESVEQAVGQASRLPAAAAAAPPPPTPTLIGMVSLEMLGYFSDQPGSQRSPIPRIEGVFEPPTVGDFIGIATTKKHSDFARRWAAAMKLASPDLKIVVADMFPFAPPDFLRSDHAPFLLRGDPALMLTDTSNFRNPNYHSPTDTINTLNREYYIRVVQGIVGATHDLANAPDQAKTPD